MEGKLPSSVKIEQLEDCVGQEINSWSPSNPFQSIQERSQKWTYDSIDMNVVKQEPADVLCEDRSHSFSKMVDIAGGSIIQDMKQEHSNSQAIMVKNSCKPLVKHENCCQVSANVFSVIDTNNELSLAIDNCQQQCKETEEKHTQIFTKSLDDSFDYVSYSSQKIHTGDLSDVSSPDVCVYTCMRTHTEGMSNKCNKWDGQLIQYDHLECQKNGNHKRTHTGEKPYKCDVCGAHYTRADHFLTHKRTHTGENPYECDDCGASFTQAGNLNIHKRMHTGEKPYKCEICGASFSHACHLKTHKRVHTGEKPYKCDVCGDSFAAGGNLKTHKRIHTGEKPYTCDVCGSSFTLVCSLKRHKRTHTGEKPYKCDVCGSSFTRPGWLKRHKRTHTGEKPCKLYVCVASLSGTGNLKTHKRTHTG